LAISKQKKQELVEKYTERLNNSQAIMLADYRGMTVHSMQDLRHQLREKNATVQVVKNTLIKIALEDADMPVPDEMLVGPTAIAFLPDDIATAAKALFAFAKDEEALEVKGAILENQVLGADAAKSLQDLPTRSDVLAQLLGAVQGPSTELVRTIEGPANELYRTLQAPLRELALTIQSYAEKGAEAGA
jgi:large subunit ribosomal protein L10